MFFPSLLKIKGCTVIGKSAYSFANIALRSQITQLYEARLHRFAKPDYLALQSHITPASPKVYPFLEKCVQVW